MKNKAIKVLLVEHSQSMTKRIVFLLQGHQCLEFNVTSVQQIRKADDAMLKTHVDIVLLDLSITKSNSADYVEQLLTHSPKIIIILLCRKMDKVIAQQAMAKGAHDCLDKSRIGLSCLRRVLEYNLRMVKSQQLLAVSEATLHAIGQASPLGIVVSDLYGNITYTNAAFQHQTGLKAAQSLGQHWITSVHQQDRLRLEEEWRQALQVQQIFHSDVRLISADNKPSRARMTGSFIKNNKALYGHVRVLQGITNQRHQSAVINLFLQNTGAGLPVTFPQLTLDAISDAVQTVRDSDTVCRQGGDEFLVLLSEIYHSNDAAKLANKLLTHLARSHQVTNKAISITLSIGISIYPNVQIH